MYPVRVARKFVAIGGVSLVAAVGCAAGDEGPAADLPAGWEHARRVEGLVQRPCGGSALGPEILSELHVDPDQDGLAISWEHAHFRCQQAVEAFVRAEPSKVDLLIQPIDMTPRAVAGCDCLYDVSLEVPLESGDYAFTLYRRWDNLNVPNDPLEVGHADVRVP